MLFLTWRKLHQLLLWPQLQDWSAIGRPKEVLQGQVLIGALENTKSGKTKARVLGSNS
jgi:hypothetical protein